MHDLAEADPTIAIEKSGERDGAGGGGAAPNEQPEGGVKTEAGGAVRLTLVISIKVFPASSSFNAKPVFGSSHTRTLPAGIVNSMMFAEMPAIVSVPVCFAFCLVKSPTISAVSTKGSPQEPENDPLLQPFAGLVVSQLIDWFVFRSLTVAVCRPSTWTSADSEPFL